MLNIQKIIGGSIQTNCYLLEYDNDIILIDFIPEVENIIIKKNYRLNEILLTHIHFDHIEELSSFQQRFKFRLGLSKAGYNFLRKPDSNLLLFFPPEVIKNYKNINLDLVKIYTENEILTWNDQHIQIIESPGHSPDGLMFILKEKRIVFTGDTIFYSGIGRTDLPGGNFEQIKLSIKKLFGLIEYDYKLYPGHGKDTSVQFEKNNNPFL